MDNKSVAKPLTLNGQQWLAHRRSLKRYTLLYRTLFVVAGCSGLAIFFVAYWYEYTTPAVVYWLLVCCAVFCVILGQHVRVLCDNRIANFKHIVEPLSKADLYAGIFLVLIAWAVGVLFLKLLSDKKLIP